MVSPISLNIETNEACPSGCAFSSAAGEELAAGDFDVARGLGSSDLTLFLTSILERGIINFAMRKRASKATGKDEYTVTEVGTLIDQFRGEFKVFGENLTSVKEDVGTIKEQVAKNSEDAALLKTAVRSLSAKIEKLTESIERLIKTKADREELLTLEKRVSGLEAKVAALSR